MTEERNLCKLLETQPSDVTIQMVQWFVENDPDQLTKVNMMGMLPIHVFMWHVEVELPPMWCGIF